MSTVITVENLGKKYVLGHRAKQESYVALRDVLSDGVRNLGRRLVGRGNATGYGTEQEDFWALKDVTFEVKQGDRIGIIGRNGAGKSTLLKILSRITEPSVGRVRIKGRVASLLEVGTGFHPELTGRENIYLNGAILGMGRTEIKRKFDEIVDFAEVEKFLDTPVKRYSSGMYVRLAFAVAAHLEPEILIVDEVLAVGDAEFQKKCLGKMETVSKEGRTVLFVSHNMDAIERLCGRVVWLQNGNIVSNSDAVSILVKEYLFGGGNVERTTFWVNENSKPSNPYFDLRSVKLVDVTGNLVPSIFLNNTEVSLLIEANIAEANKTLNVGYVLYSEDGKAIYWSFSTDTPEEKWPKLSVGKNRIATQIPPRLLNEGSYIIEVMASLHEQIWLLEPGKSSNSISFHISGGLSDSPFWFASRPGILAPVLTWENYSEEVHS